MSEIDRIRERMEHGLSLGDSRRDLWHDEHVDRDMATLLEAVDVAHAALADLAAAGRAIDFALPHIYGDGGERARPEWDARLYAAVKRAEEVLKSWAAVGQRDGERGG